MTWTGVMLGFLGLVIVSRWLLIGAEEEPLNKGR
jgi:hypothetical protein